MRVLLPDLPEFRALSTTSERSVPGCDLTYYSSGHVPDGEATGVVLWFASAETRDRLLATPGLKWVLTLTAGIDHIRNLIPPGVQLYNANRLHERAVAVHALAGMLTAARGFHRFRDAQARAEWASPKTLSESGLVSLDRARVVLWGFGHIGRNLEDLLRPFDVFLNGISSATTNTERDEFLETADFVVLLLPSTPDTVGIVNGDILGRIRRGAWLVNVGRGNLIVRDDLIAAIQSGQLAGAVLDVTDPEPLPQDDPLWAEENVIITPHIASTTTDLVYRGASLTRDFLIDFQQGREPEGLVESWRKY
ncbi:NAD(P)-dependent oxidoreductase [Deinococcus yunweiensis]|uniref:NAD(P)-dependent oxidoreductase n=1 Tax=Deinococcus yunweiensis TaxID=367282 RepID=UPI00398F080B